MWGLLLRHVYVPYERVAKRTLLAMCEATTPERSAGRTALLAVDACALSALLLVHSDTRNAHETAPIIPAPYTLRSPS